jgi:hypothetical protein
VWSREKGEKEERREVNLKKRRKHKREIGHKKARKSACTKTEDNF